MEIIVPDVGHGNCVGIFCKEMPPLLIDCGSENSQKKFTPLIKYQLDKAKSGDLIITHYHFDHYNLLSSLPDWFFDNIYLPALPQQSATAQAMLNFLALTIVARYQNYYLIPLIWTHGKIHCKVKDCHFNAMGRDWNVLWPDYNIIDKRNARKIGTIFNEVDKLKKELSEDQRREFEKWYNRLSKSFSGELEKPDFSPEEISKGSQTDKKVQESLKSVEKVFKDLANRSSLVVEDALIDFLFTGDIDDTILNQNHYLNFGDHHYFLIEAAHHGGHYGYAFDNASTEVLVISRNVNDKIRCEYLRDLPWAILADTARIGNCIIQL